MWLVSTYAIGERAIEAQWPEGERLLYPTPDLEPTRTRLCKFYKRVTQQRKNSAPKFLDQVGKNWKVREKLVQMSLEDVRKAFAPRQCGILICRVTQQHTLDRKHPKCIRNWLREREKAVNKIKQCGKERRKEEASKAASSGAMGVYLVLCISDLESDAII